QDLDGLLHFIPWDHDLAYGGYPTGNCAPSDWIAYRSPLIEGMTQVPEFRARLSERWAELRADQLSEANILGLVELYNETIGDAAYANFEVWPMDEIEFSWDGINWLCPVASVDEERARFEDWILARLEWMDANIDEY
ncbi:MAG: CotH kinase family protein, partial [Myxococcota bacterium]|nr:CotH kinase family protein [Myxococcota bacterium]